MSDQKKPLQKPTSPQPLTPEQLHQITGGKGSHSGGKGKDPQTN